MAESMFHLRGSQVPSSTLYGSWKQLPVPPGCGTQTKRNQSTEATSENVLFNSENGARRAKLSHASEFSHPSLAMQLAGMGQQSESTWSCVCQTLLRHSPTHSHSIMASLREHIRSVFKRQRGVEESIQRGGHLPCMGLT